MTPSDDGQLIFWVGQPQLLGGIRNFGVGNGDAVSADVQRVFELTGLVEADGGGGSLRLTASGLALYRAAWVQHDEPATRRLLGQALRSLLPIQVLGQELGNTDPIPESGAVHLLALHRVVPPTFTADDARLTFRWLNDLGVVVYSRQKKTVRFVPDDPGAAKAGEVRSLGAMISPRTPYSNVVRLRRVLRTQSGVVTWADPHFGARALEELADELDPSKATELRIISGDAPNVLSPRSFKDFQRFKHEMSNKGINVEWRVDTARDWHDRFLVDANGSFNVPPVNNLFKNEYSEILPSDSKPPVDEWWARSTPRTT